MKSAPMVNAWASPLGWLHRVGQRDPERRPVVGSRWKAGMSCGVVMTRMSRIPARIRVDNG